MAMDKGREAWVRVWRVGVEGTGLYETLWRSIRQEEPTATSSPSTSLLSWLPHKWLRIRPRSAWGGRDREGATVARLVGGREEEVEAVEQKKEDEEK